MLRSLSNQFKNKYLYNSLISLFPSLVLFSVSYSIPTIATIGLFWQIYLPVTIAVACIIAGYDYLKLALINLINIRKSPRNFLDMNLLVSLSTVSSFCFVLFLGVNTPLILLAAPLLTLGALNLSNYFKDRINNWLETEKQQKISNYRKILPSITNLIKIQRDYILIIQPNTYIPVDATLLSEEALINDGTIFNGEQHKQQLLKQGCKLYAGYQYIGTDPIRIKASCTGLESIHYKRLQQLTSNQNSERAILINKIINWFIPLVLSISLSSLIIWSILSSPVVGISVMMNVIFAACPCALGMIMTLPSSLLRKMALNYKISIFDDNVIETLPKSDTLVFDKTGTLTELSLKQIKLNKSFNLPLYKEYIFSSIYQLQEHRINTDKKQRASDPYANAIVHYFNQNDRAISEAQSKKIINILSNQTNGIAAKLSEDYNLFIGNAEFLKQYGFTIESNSNEVYIALERGSDKQIYGEFKFTQALKPDAENTITELQKLGYQIHMLTGDEEDNANIIAKSLNIKNVKSNCTPDNKKRYIEALIKAGYTVTMIGDGFNDFEPAKAASCSIAVGKDSIMNGFFNATIDRLSDLLKLIQICKATDNNQRQLFFITIGYNTIAMILAAIVFPALGMPMMMGCFGTCMALSSLAALAWSTILVPRLNQLLQGNAPDSLNNTRSITTYQTQDLNNNNTAQNLYEFRISVKANCMGCVGGLNKLKSEFFAGLSAAPIDNTKNSIQDGCFTINFSLLTDKPQNIQASLDSFFEAKGKTIAKKTSFTLISGGASSIGNSQQKLILDKPIAAVCSPFAPKRR